jgi:enterochelin esterase family protein
MKQGPLLRTTLVAGLLLVIQPAMAQAKQPPKMPSPEQMRAMMFPCGQFKSVEQLTDNRVTFRLCAPKANEVQLAGSDVPQVPMFGLLLVKDEKGPWGVTTDAIAPDTYRYTFRVDGVTVPDPQATTFSETRNGTTSAFEILGAAGDFQTFNKSIPHGTVAVVNYWSAPLGVQRRAHIYLPPGYDNSSKKSPVLYLVHGAGDCDDSWTSVGRAHFILDNLIASGKAAPMIVAMPAGHTPDRPNASMANMLANTDFRDDFFKERIPYVEGHYRTINDPAHRAMAGLSMGGAHMLQNGMTHSDMFSYIGVFSIGLFDEASRADYEARNGATLDRGAREFKAVRYYIGKDDFLYGSVAPTKALLEKHRIKVGYVESEGAHTRINWRRYFNDFVPYLFK